MSGYSLSGSRRSRGRSGASVNSSSLSSAGRQGHGLNARPSATDSACSELWNVEDRLLAPPRQLGHSPSQTLLQDDRVPPQMGSLEQGICMAATEAVQNIWQTAEYEMLAVVEAGGGLQETDADKRYAALLDKALIAEQRLRSACAEMRICRAEMMIQLGVGGRALHSAPCWEACGSPNQTKGNGKSCGDCGMQGKLYFDKGWGKWYCAQCWFDGYHEWPDTSLFLQTRVVLNKYEVSPDDILGQGGFSIVRRGRHLETGEIVAVKAYSSMETLDPAAPSYEEDKAFYLQKFCHEVVTFQRLHAEEDVKAQIQDLKRMGTGKRSSWYVPENLDTPESPGGLLDIFSRLPDPSMLFVRLEAFSVGSDGLPGPSPNGECCVALELAEYTLDEFLKNREAVGDLLVATEVQEIFKQLAEVLAMLHSKKFVHCDLKPLNIMHFPSGRWKLIDMDGMVMTGGTANLCDVFYTPLYSSPEFAELTLGEDDIFQVSRLFDVWSLGAILVELATLQPWLQDKYNEFTEGDDFMLWLADTTKDMPLPPLLTEIDVRLPDLCSQMLEQNVELRASMVEVLLHPFVTDSEFSPGLSEKKINYMHTIAEAKAMQEQVGVRRKSNPRPRELGAGTCVKKRVSVLFPEAPPRRRSSDKFKLEPCESVGSAFSDVSDAEYGQDAFELKPISSDARDDMSVKRNVWQESPPLAQMSTTPSTSSTQKYVQPVPLVSDVDATKLNPAAAKNTSRNTALTGNVPDKLSSWTSLRNQAKAAQTRASLLYRYTYQKLKEKEALASGLEAIFWAATEAEASLWREARIPPQVSLSAMSDERCAELEGHVERASRGLQAAQAELWEARDLDKLVRECQGLAAAIPAKMSGESVESVV